MIIIGISLISLVIIGFFIWIFLNIKRNRVLNLFKEELKISNFLTNKADYSVQVKSSRAVQTYDVEKLLRDELDVETILSKINFKNKYNNALERLIKSGKYSELFMYKSAVQYVFKHLISNNYIVKVWYVSPAGRSRASTILAISEDDVLNSNYYVKLKNTVTKEAIKEIKLEEQKKREEIKTQKEKLKYEMQLQKLNEKKAKEEAKEKLENKKDILTKKVDSIINNIQRIKDRIIFDEDINELDNLSYQLKELSLNDVNKVKEFDSNNFDIIERVILDISKKIVPIVQRNERLYKYYNSDDFNNLKKSL